MRVCVCVCVSVCVWSGGCELVRVEEHMAERACFVVRYSFDYCFV